VNDLDERLSRIQTLWTLVRKAHGGPAHADQSAQQQLLDRYGGAIRRYLLGAIRDAEAADELFQEFACKLLAGQLQGADPGRGRFRDFVKGVLFHLVADHHRQRKRQPGQMAQEHLEPAVDDPTLATRDQNFLTSWRDEILARSWSALERLEQDARQPIFTVLRFRAEHPKLSSTEMAEQLGQKLGRELSAANARQILHRAREKFADLVLDEVVHSLENPTAEHVESELEELGLMEYCRPALDRRG
jgi:RNA polymerase sigma factor (sigma-70 family)